jgi:hypothetical protein
MRGEEPHADLTQTLLVPFAAGFIVQRFLDVLDPLVSAFVPDSKKRVLVSLTLLAIGLVFSVLAES